jgi:hypothetical protein
MARLLDLITNDEVAPPRPQESPAREQATTHRSEPSGRSFQS